MSFLPGIGGSSIWSRLQGLLFGGAIGAAMSKSLEAVLEPVRQKAWKANQFKIFDPAVLAELSAKGFAQLDDLVDEAARNGWNRNRLQALYDLSQTYPGLADLDKLSNRSLITPEQVKRSLARHGFGDEWTEPITALFQDLLSVADAAAAVQQGHLPNTSPLAPGETILPDISPAVTPAFGYTPPTAPDGQPPSDVPLTQVDLDALKEAMGQGFDLPRFQVRANLSGLPPGPAELLAMWNRNEITEEAVDAGLREGHLKTKWSGAFKRMRWAVLGASEYANAYIRAWITEAEMIEGGALTGHTPAQMELLYKNRGRPLAPVQAFTAWAREAPHPKIPGEPERPGTFDYQDFEEAVRRSDVQTWYAPVEWELRWAYPPLFQLGRLAQAGALPEERVRAILKKERYEPQDIDALVTFWYTPKGSGPTVAPVIKTQTTAAITALRKAYTGGDLDKPTADSFLAALDHSVSERVAIFDIWDVMRGIEGTPLDTTGFTPH